METEPILIMAPMSVSNSPVMVSSCPTIFTNSPMMTSNSPRMVSSYPTTIVSNPSTMVSNYSSMLPYHYTNAPMMVSSYTTMAGNPAQGSGNDNWMVTVIGGSEPAASNSSMMTPRYHTATGEIISTSSNSSMMNSRYQTMVSSYPMMTANSHVTQSDYSLMNSRYSTVAANNPTQVPNSAGMVPSYPHTANSLQAEDCTIISPEYPTVVGDFVAVSNSPPMMVSTPPTTYSNSHIASPMTAVNSALIASNSPSMATDTIFPVATLVFFDLETTGLAKDIGKANVHITELSLIAIDRKEYEESKSKDLGDIRLVNKLSLCVKPRVHVSSGAAAVTGLDDKKLQYQQHFDEDLALMLCSFIKRLPKPACLLAHNGNVFDFPLLRAELQRLDLQLPDDVLCADTLLGFRQLGLADLDNTSGPTKQKRGKFWQPYSLLNLHLHFFKRKPANGHHAEGDCKTLMMVCSKMKERFVRWIDENNSLFSAISVMW